MVKIYYGMSGTLKYTSIKATQKPGDGIVLSGVKPYLNLSQDLLCETPRDLDFALFRLVQLKTAEAPKYDLLVERGITDFLESWTAPGQPGESDRWDEGFMKPWTDKETETLKYFGEISRELLIMKDRKFIEEKVLSEPSRRRRFPDVETYLKRQSEYIEFTKAWNKIGTITEITDAWKFIRLLEK